jgi:hypothetical protein
MPLTWNTDVVLVHSECASRNGGGFLLITFAALNPVALTWIGCGIR